MSLSALFDVPAPAKLNLFLHVIGRRADGYHLLQSVFQLIDWCDRLHFELRHDGALMRHDLGPALPADDLCLRAARALQAQSGTALGADIFIDKQLPWGAGLGGGSSDAATVLLALNQLWGLHWPRSRLLALAERLGADVPFFVRGHNAWVEGIGEQITPLALPDEVLQTPLMLLKPAIAVPTAAIFGSDALKRDTKPAIVSDFLAAPKRFGQNDLQDAAVAYQASSDSGNDIGLALEVMQNHFGNSRMTGSGSTVFSWIPPEQTSHLTPIQPSDLGLNDALWIGRVCRGLPQHPLLKMLDQIAD